MKRWVTPKVQTSKDSRSRREKRAKSYYKSCRGHHRTIWKRDVWWVHLPLLQEHLFPAQPRTATLAGSLPAPLMPPLLLHPPLLPSFLPSLSFCSPPCFCSVLPSVFPSWCHSLGTREEAVTVPLCFVQSLSCVRLCNHVDRSTPGFLVPTLEKHTPYFLNISNTDM